MRSKRKGVTQGKARVDALGVEKPLEIVHAAASKLALAGKVGTVGYCWAGSNAPALSVAARPMNALRDKRFQT